MRKTTIAKYKFVIIVLKATRSKLEKYLKVVDKEYLKKLSGKDPDKYCRHVQVLIVSLDTVITYYESQLKTGKVA